MVSNVKQRVPKKPEPMPMTCAVCKECYRDEETFRIYGITRCEFGGPYSGYIEVE